MKTVFIFSHSQQIKWYAVFAKAIKDCLPNASIVLFVHGKDDCLYADQFPVYDTVIDLIHDFTFDPTLTLGDLTISSSILELESDLGMSFFWEDMKVDRWIRAKDDASFSIQYINHAFGIFYDLYRRDRPVLGFGESTMAIYRLAHHAFDRDKLPYIAPISARYTARFYFEDDWYWSWNNCLNLYEDYMKKGIPDDLVDITEDLYQELAIRGTKPVAFENFTKDNEESYTPLKITNISRIFSVLKNLRSLKSDFFKNNIRYSIIERSIIEKVVRVFKNYYDHFKYSRLVSNKVLANQTYSIYFLHYQPEYTVDSLGKFYHDQINLISNIASSLPADQLLYVKEHPAMIGLRDSKYYEQILKHTNVVLLHHGIDSLKLIREAKIVFSIVGTVGLEAIFNRVPAIMFGRYAFSNIGTCTFCDNVWELNKLIRNKLENKDDDAIIEVSKALLAAKYAGSYPGQIPVSADTIDPFYADKEQHVFIGEAMKMELTLRGVI